MFFGCGVGVGMDKADLELFLGKIVRIVKPDNFVIYGQVDKVNDDNIFLKTNNGLVILQIKNILEIAEKPGGWI